MEALFGSLLKTAESPEPARVGKKKMFTKNGGVKSVPIEEVQSYIERLKKREEATPITKRIRSVQKLKKSILSNPVLRMTFEGAINSIPPGGVLQYSNLEAILNHLHQIATTPPSFEDKDITGVPFYAIFVDFLDNYYGQAFFASPIINAHLKEIFNDYATMLKSKKSLMYMNDGEKGWFSPKALEYITDYDSYICNPQEPHYGFLSWNDWFSRAFKPGARPLDPNPLVIVNSSESFPLPNQPTKNIQALDQFWLKDNRYSLYDMLAVEEYDTKAIADLFIGGTIYQAFLNPWCYHRWHAPVNGEVEKSYTIQGTYYLEQPYRASPISQEELISRLVLLNVDKTAIKPTEDYVDSQPFLSVVSTRHVFVFNTHNPQIGRVIVIEIGMAEVSSCNPIVNEGDFVEKGQDVGHFEFGGSSHLLIFEKGVQLAFNPKIYEADETGSLVKQLVNSTLATVIPK